MIESRAGSETVIFASLILLIYVRTINKLPSDPRKNMYNLKISLE